MLQYQIGIISGFYAKTQAKAFSIEFGPRSPVPLPDAATCKPILVQLGFTSLSSAEKMKRKKGKQISPMRENT